MKAKVLRKKICKYCGKTFETYYGQSKYCSKKCKNRGWAKVKSPLEKVRHCKICGEKFQVTGHQGAKQHCSDKCARESARRSRERFQKKNPSAHNGYNKTRVRRHGPDTLTKRFFQKYPDIEKKCRVCGEDRVLELHHVEKRNGAARTMRNTTAENIWVLCPTCHALIERKICTSEELGLL